MSLSNLLKAYLETFVKVRALESKIRNQETTANFQNLNLQILAQAPIKNLSRFLS
jgi:hypothetical protein